MMNDKDQFTIISSLSITDEMLVRERFVQIQRSEVFLEPRPYESSYQATMDVVKDNLIEDDVEVVQIIGVTMEEDEQIDIFVPPLK